MIYSKEVEWTNPYKEIRVNGYVMLDLNVLDEIPQEFEELEKQCGRSAKLIRKEFEDSLICDSVKYLHTRIKCVILRYDSYAQKLQKMQRLISQAPLNQHQLILKQYENDVKIGVRIPLDRLSEFPNEHIKPFLKQINILSFQLHVDTIEHDAPLLSEFIKKYVTLPRKKVHIHFRMHAEDNLAKFHHFMIKYQFPIEYIILSTNLLNVYLEESPLSSNPQKPAFLSRRDYRRFIGSAYANILQSIEASQEILSEWGGVKELETNNTFKPINKLLYLLKQVEYYYKKQHNRSYTGGARVPSLLLINSIRIFRGVEANYGFLKDCLENFALYPIKVVYQEQFIGLENIKKTND